jgi:hypothetical protein
VGAAGRGPEPRPLAAAGPAPPVAGRRGHR